MAINTKTEKKLLKMESYFCVEGSAEIDANLQHVSEIERDVQRKKNRTISRVFFPFWYNIEKDRNPNLLCLKSWIGSCC